MPKIGSVVNKKATAKVKFGEETLTFTYDPSKWTPAFESKLKIDDDNPFVSRLYAKMLSNTLIDWDLTEDDEVTMVPLTEERLCDLPSRLLADVVEVLTEDMSPKKKTSTNSGSF